MFDRRIQMGCALALLFCLLAVPVCADSSEDELIIRAVASSYPDADFGAKTALCAVILNRMEDSGYPDTAAGVIRAADSGFDPLALASVRDEKILRITRDACRAARAGADPTGGLLGFEVLPKPTRKDNRADFSASLDLSKYRVVMGGIGFY
ncbi:MAG: cell wall hydrolase [Clostridia bacterium]|nr:cell wall hydrolase [Clostridia bacterium]